MAAAAVATVTTTAVAAAATAAAVAYVYSPSVIGGLTLVAHTPLSGRCYYQGYPKPDPIVD